MDVWHKSLIFDINYLQGLESTFLREKTYISLIQNNVFPFIFANNDEELRKIALDLMRKHYFELEALCH